MNAPIQIENSGYNQNPWALLFELAQEPPKIRQLSFDYKLLIFWEILKFGSKFDGKCLVGIKHLQKFKVAYSFIRDLIRVLLESFLIHYCYEDLIFIIILSYLFVLEWTCFPIILSFPLITKLNLSIKTCSLEGLQQSRQLTLLQQFKMASINELKEVLKQTLEERGILSQIRAQIRSEIFGTLNGTTSNRPELSKQNLIINELIREYLIFNGYQHTLSVFVPQSGQPSPSPFDRGYITKQLKIIQDKKSQELPLLYGLTFGNKKQINQQ